MDAVVNQTQDLVLETVSESIEEELTHSGGFLRKERC